MRSGKKILVGVCGSIAAYKSAFLVRLLVKSGAQVKVVMTHAATDFISPLTLSTLSKNPTLSDFVANDQGEWNNHVELGLWADAFVIAPASANTLSKMANGICDNLLLAAYLSAKCPVFAAPAMDLDMYQHTSTQSNIEKLKDFGNHIIDAAYGELASGLVGTGRMAEPEIIQSVLTTFFEVNLPLKGMKALVTAGPTQEKIDPVRFIGNHSTGKMGLAIANRLSECGAEVTLVLGPVPKIEISGNVRVLRVTSAEEMFAAAHQEFPGSDITVLAAAVADFKPKNVSETKIKKKDNDRVLELIATPDIALKLGEKKSKGQVVVGFALETNNEVTNAREKLKSKNFDMIVLNSLAEDGAGFGYDTNKITILFKDNKSRNFELKSKKEVAKDIVDAIIERHF